MTSKVSEPSEIPWLPLGTAEAVVLVFFMMHHYWYILSLTHLPTVYPWSYWLQTPARGPHFETHLSELLYLIFFFFFFTNNVLFGVIRIVFIIRFQHLWFNWPPVLLGNNWYTALCACKVYSIIIRLTNNYAKGFDCVDHNKLRKILKEMGIPDHLTCLLRNLYADQATVRTRHVTMDWFQTGKGVHQGCILSHCLFDFCAECKTHKLESSLGEIPSTSDNQMILPLWQKVKRN